MHPLLITITFLTLLAAMVTGKVKQFVSHSIEDKIYANFEKTAQEVDEMRADSLLHERKCSDCTEEELRPYNKKRKSVPKKIRKITVSSLNVNSARPPDNSRFNLWLVVNSQDPTIKMIGAKLIRKLYGNHPLFANHPNLEYAILEALQVNKEKTKLFSCPDDLVALELDNPKVAAAFYFIMRGGVDLEGNIYPSFLYYTTFNAVHKGETRKINLMFASEELLEVIFEDDEMTQRVLQMRSRIWDIIENQESERLTMEKGEAFNRTQIKDLLKSSFEDIVISCGKEMKYYKDLFDLTLSHEGNFLIVYDPETEITVREKVPVVFPALHKE